MRRQGDPVAVTRKWPTRATYRPDPGLVERTCIAIVGACAFKQRAESKTVVSCFWERSNVRLQRESRTSSSCRLLRVTRGRLIRTILPPQATPPPAEFKTDDDSSA